jgi:hypothetical protein
LVKQLTCSKDIVDAITKRQKIANDNNSKQLLDYILNLLKFNNLMSNFILVNSQTTIAISLDSDEEQPDLLYNHKSLTIQNVQSFYNYRSIKDIIKQEYELFTSILSNESQLSKLKVKSMDVANNTFVYEVLHEEKIKNYPTSLSILHLKKNRINSAFFKIKENCLRTPSLTNHVETNKNFYDYFTFDRDLDNNNLANENRALPIYCRGAPGTLKKPPCKNCDSPCSYEMEKILRSTNAITQSDIVEELKAHGHPTSRIIDLGDEKKQRVTHQAARELADHYIYAHNKKEPII